MKYRFSFESQERFKEIKKLYKQIRAQIRKINASYKARTNKHQQSMVFKLGDLVWLHLRKEIFSSRRLNKLMT